MKIHPTEFRVISGRVTSVVGPAGRTATSVLSLLFKGTGISGAKEWPLPARVGVCFVPPGAPLLGHRSAAANVSHLCLLSGGRAPLPEQVTHALRLAELPDERAHAKASVLDEFERFAVWLAVHRLRQSHTLVVDDPGRGLTAPLTDRVARLLVEAAEIPSAVVVISPDAGFAGSVENLMQLPHQS